MSIIKKGKKNAEILYTICFLLIWGMLLLPFVLRGNSLIEESDSFHQSYTIFVYNGRMFWELLKGDCRQFDFSLGLGDDVITALNWHGLGDPFQILAIFAKDSMAECMFGFNMLFKYFLCGISFLQYSKKRDLCIEISVSGALLYTFSTFALIRGLNCWMFLNPMITFPFVLLGIEELIHRQKKWSLHLILGIFAQALCGFYFIYMFAILGGLYYCCFYWFERDFKEKKGIKSFIFSGVRIAVQALLGCCLAGFLIIPSIIGYLGSNRIGNEHIFKTITELVLYPSEYYSIQMSGLIIPDAYNVCITITSICLLGTVTFLIQEKNYQYIRILIIILCVGMCTPILGSIMNGFSYSTDRWYFAVLLFLITGATIAMQKWGKTTKATIWIYAGIVGITVLFHLKENGISFGSLFRIFVFIAVSVLTVICWHCHKNRKRILLLGTVISVAMYGFFMFGPTVLGGNGYSARFKAWRSTYEELEASVKGLEITSEMFKRQDIYASSMNAATVLEYYGTAEYYSMLNANVSEFYHDMFISPGYRSATWILRGLDGRQALETLLSVEHYMDFVTDEEGSQKSFVEKNNVMLPLGITFEQWLPREEFDALNPIEKQDSLLKSIVVESDYKGQYSHCDDIITDFREIEMQLEEIGLEKSGNHIRTKNGSRFRLWLTGKEWEKICEQNLSGELYVQFKDFILYDEGIDEVMVGNKNLQVRSREDDYYTGTDEFWVNVTEIKELNNRKYIDIIFESAKEYHVGEMNIYWYNTSEIVSIANEKRDEVLQKVVIDTNCISGNIETDSDKILFLSIPYSEGWKAYVNGEQIPIYKADIAFMAIPLKKGVNEMCLIYHTPGLKMGAFISIGSLIVILIYAIKKLKVNDRED